MDFTESKRQAARDIALALGVPPMLLGIPGDNTHANYQEANPSLLAPHRAAVDHARAEGAVGLARPGRLFLCRAFLTRTGGHFA